MRILSILGEAYEMLSRGRCLGDTHGFTLPTAFMKHLLCAQHPAGPWGPEVGVTSSCPVRTHSWAGIQKRPPAWSWDAVCLQERENPINRRPYRSNPGPASSWLGAWASPLGCWTLLLLHEAAGVISTESGA